jgi:segregation and condensation protein B
MSASIPPLVQILEALVTASEEPLDTPGLVEALRRAVAFKRGDIAEEEILPPGWEALEAVGEEDIEAAIAALNRSYHEHGHALAVVRRPRGWQLMTRPEFSEFLLSLFPERRSQRLSGPALETLAIIGYRQPVTKAEIESVRGVSADGMLQKLLDLEFIKIGGRAELPGRPLQYVTTEKFLEHFNLKSPEELPNSHELRRVRLPTAEEANAQQAAQNQSTEPGVAETGVAEASEPPESDQSDESDESDESDQSDELPGDEPAIP